MATEIVPGTCSAALPRHAPDEVLEVATSADLTAIEWDAVAHVPAGDTAAAEAVGRRTRDAGLSTPSYGTDVGRAPGVGDAAFRDEVERSLATAAALGVEVVRVWPEQGVRPSSPEADRMRVVERTRHLAQRGASHGLRVALAFQPDTLTDTGPATVELLAAVDHPNAATYWQPDPRLAAGETVADLDLVGLHLAHLHVAHRTPDGTRLPLSAGDGLWPRALAAARRHPIPTGGPRVALLEAVRDDDPDQLLADAGTLRHWLL